MSPIRKAGALIFERKKLLVVKPLNSEMYINPGGKYERDETTEHCLRRELREELNVELNAFIFFKTYELVRAANAQAPLSLELYHVSAHGTPEPCAEIERLYWLSKKDFEEENCPLAPSFDLFIPDLIRLGYL